MPTSEHTSVSPDRQIAEDLVAGLAMLAIAAVFLGKSGADRLDWLFPKVLAWSVIAMAVILVGRGLLGYGDKIAAIPPIVRGRGVDVTVFIALTALYVALMRPVGFWPMSTLVIFVGAVFLDPERTRRRVLLAGVIAVAMCVTWFLLLSRVFYVPLPRVRWLPLF